MCSHFWNTCTMLCRIHTSSSKEGEYGVSVLVLSEYHWCEEMICWSCKDLSPVANSSCDSRVYIVTRYPSALKVRTLSLPVKGER